MFRVGVSTILHRPRYPVQDRTTTRHRGDTLHSMSYVVDDDILVAVVVENDSSSVDADAAAKGDCDIDNGDGEEEEEVEDVAAVDDDFVAFIASLINLICFTVTNAYTYCINVFVLLTLY